MNFKQFLDKEVRLNESCVLYNNYPVVIGYGSFSPFHIGYLSMISEIVKLSEQHQAESILVIIPQKNIIFEKVLPGIICTIKENFPFIKVMVESSPADALMKLSSFDRIPKVLIGESIFIKQAANACSTIYGKDALIDRVAWKSDNLQHAAISAAYNNDLNEFRSMILECSSDVAQSMFDYLRDQYNG